MRFIFFILLPVIVMAHSNNTACFRDLVVLKNVGTEFILIYTTAGCNLLLLILNATILYAVLGYMKPTISEIRKQTFIIMDNILLSYIPAGIRDVLGCPHEVILGGGKPTTTGKGKAKGTTKPSVKSSAKSRTSTGTEKSGGTTGGTAAASE